MLYYINKTFNICIEFYIIRPYFICKYYPNLVNIYENVASSALIVNNDLGKTYLRHINWRLKSILHI